MESEGFRQLIDLSYRNQTNTDKHLQLRFRKPDILKSNLDTKRMRVRKFSLNNTYVPIFIPERIKSTEQSYFNIPMTTTNTIVNNTNTLTSNSLKYYITVRSTTAPYDAFTVFLQQIPESPQLQQPFSILDNDVEYYSNEYYWYHDMTHFLNILSQSIYTAVPSYTAPEITIGQNGYTFYFEKVFTQQQTIEFSESLIKLFPLKSYISPYTTGSVKSYVLDFNSFEVSSGTTTYKKISCFYYEKAFPWSELVINSDDLAINYTMFLDDEIIASNAQQAIEDNNILTYSLRTTQYNRIYDFYEYTNEQDGLWNNFYLNSSATTHLNIKFYLRLKNGILLPFKLKPDDFVSLTLEILSLV